MDSVFFRAFEPEDAILIYKWKNDFDLLNMAVGMNRKISYEDCLEWVKDKSKHHYFEIYWAICLNDDTKKMIGYTHLNKIHYINRDVESGGIIIGDKDYRDGIIWIEIYQILMSYVFDVLNLNRFYGICLNEHKLTMTMMTILFWSSEGLFKQSVYKKGKYHDIVMWALLREDYYRHKMSGDYETTAIIKRIRTYRKELNSNKK